MYREDAVQPSLALREDSRNEMLVRRWMQMFSPNSNSGQDLYEVNQQGGAQSSLISMQYGQESVSQSALSTALGEVCEPPCVLAFTG